MCVCSHDFRLFFVWRWCGRILPDSPAVAALVCLSGRFPASSAALMSLLLRAATAGLHASTTPLPRRLHHVGLTFPSLQLLPSSPFSLWAAMRSNSRSSLLPKFFFFPPPWLLLEKESENRSWIKCHSRVRGISSVFLSIPRGLRLSRPEYWFCNLEIKAFFSPPPLLLLVLLKRSLQQCLKC